MSVMRLLQPVPGDPVPIAEVGDEVFAQEMLGPSVAVQPPADLDEATVVAPADGVLTVMYRTGHAFVLTTDEGPQILVHVGIDTVHSDAGFTALAAQNQRVRRGDPLLRVDLSALRQAERPAITVVAVMGDPEARIELFEPELSEPEPSGPEPSEPGPSEPGPSEAGRLKAGPSEARA